jgi:hypothetical protein
VNPNANSYYGANNKIHNNNSNVSNGIVNNNKTFQAGNLSNGLNSFHSGVYKEPVMSNNNSIINGSGISGIS